MANFSLYITLRSAYLWFPVWGFFLKKKKKKYNRNPNSGANGGQLTLGGIDSTKYVGSITYTDTQLILGLFKIFWMVQPDS